MMKNFTKKSRLAALALAVVMALGLTACAGESEASQFEAETYVDGLLKENYLGVFEEDYLALVGSNEVTAAQVYEDSMGVEANYFLQIYDVEFADEEFYMELIELYKEIYSHAKFEVISAAMQEDGSYSVKVEVEPIDIIHLVEEDFEEAAEEFYAAYPAQKQNAMTDEEYEAMDKEWQELLMGLYRENLEDIGNRAPVSVTIQLEKNDQGYYAIPSEDFARLDALIIDYDGVGVEEEAEESPQPTPSAEPDTEGETPAATETPAETQE